MWTNQSLGFHNDQSITRQRYNLIYWFFESSHREKQASLRILRKYEGYDNLWMWCDACDIWMRGGQVAQKLTFEASLAHNLILCANSAGSLCCFNSQKSEFFLVWEYLRYPLHPPTHKIVKMFFLQIFGTQTWHGRGPNWCTYNVQPLIAPLPVALYHFRAGAAWICFTQSGSLSLKCKIPT